MANEALTIPFNQPYLSGNELAHIQEAVSSGKHCGNHRFGKLCIKLIREIYGIGQAFLTPSATAALEMATILADIQPGDEVLMPSYTFSSTANAFCLRGARPVFVDIDPDTLVIDHRLIAEKITSRTKAIVPINYGGVSPELDEINALAKARGLVVIEDAAQGIGAKYKGRYVGSITPISVFSFHETKNISCGEGGALLLNDPSLEQLATFAQEKGTDRSLVIAGIQSKYSWVSLGSSYLLADILAAMLYEQLQARNAIAERRRIAFEGYQRLFAKYESEGRVRTQRIPASCETNYHGYTLVFPEGDERDRFIAFMKEHKIMCYIGYLALHSSRMGREVCRSVDRLPVTEHIESRIVRLPVHCGITKEHFAFFAEKARQFFDGGAS